MSRKRNRSYYKSRKRVDIEAKIQERELVNEFWDEKEEREENVLEEAELMVAKPEDGSLEVVTNGEQPELVPEKDGGSKQKWYVLDTNLILSCVNVLYDPEDEHWRSPLNFEPSLTDAHLIIPETVKDELNNFKTAKTFNGMAARTALKRLARLLSNSGRSLEEIAFLKHPIPTGLGKQTISVLPLLKDYSKCLPWVPAWGDHDGWIAASALFAKMVRLGITTDGMVDPTEVLKLKSGDDEVVLLTNDADLLEKADRYGVAARPYEFSLRRPYKGCRELTVPAEMFEQFYHEEYLSQEDFEYYMPDELSLVANEYIIMEPEGDRYPRSYFASAKSFGNIARFHKENGMLYPLRFVRREGVTPPNAGIAAYYDALNDDKLLVIIVEGAAGRGKTFQAVVHAIREVKAGRRTKVYLISSKESKNALGALPGKKKDKMAPLMATCKSAIASYLITTPEFKKKREKLRKYGDVDEERISYDADTDYKNGKTKRKKAKNDINFTYGIDYADDGLVGGFEKTSKSQRKKAKGGSGGEEELFDKTTSTMTYDDFLNKQVDYIFDRYFECIPREEVDGLTLHDAIIIVDEIQRIHDLEELLTILTRSAANSKMILCGDTKQIRKTTDEKLLNNGITYAKARYFDWERAACICLTENMRGGGSEYETEDYVEAYARIAGY